jgi:hypothetical protein
MWSKVRAFQFEILGALFALAAAVSWNSFWTESEMWSATAIKYFKDNPGNYNFTVKPLTNVLLYLSFSIAKSLDVHPMETARALYAAGFLALIYLCYLVIQRRARTATWTAVIMLLLLTNSYLLKRASHVRSDLMASTVIVAWLWWSLSPAGSAAGRLKSTVTFMGLSLLAVLITPKAALWVAALFLIQFTRGRMRLALIMGIIAAFVLAFIQPQWTKPLPALYYFIASTHAGFGSLDYLSPLRFSYVKSFLLQNPVMLLIWLRHLWAGFYDRPGRSRDSLVLIDFANVTWLIFLLYPDRLPFFIASLVPFWILPLAELPEDRWAKKVWASLSSPFRRGVTGVAVTLSLLSFVFWTYNLAFRHNAGAQRAYVGWIRQFEPQLAKLDVYDPAGIIPFLRVNHWFLGPGDFHNQDVIEAIRARPPQVILVTDKIFLVAGKLQTLLRQDYWWDGAGILIRRQEVRPPARRILGGEEILTNIRPYVLDKDGQPLDEFYLELVADNGLNLSRFATWTKPDGSSRPFHSQVHREDFSDSLNVPEGVHHFNVYPIMMATPFTAHWSDLFRFDTEN